MKARWETIEALFHLALEQGEESLTEACGGDEELRAEVLSLLASDRAVPAAPAKAPLPKFGPYQCEVILGSGGMGTVYRASRDDGQFTQQVAIKVLRGSLRNEAFRERFLAERQILAQLSHPNIARLLDGGMTAEGEPYLVMELVDGEPIDRYCGREKLSLDQRIDLFDQVMEAVDYAHRQLVIHRDLKPGNIFVTGDGVVKLLDFGTARFMSVDPGVTTTLPLLTPRYASPEQLRFQPVGTASDVFSLGATLYELLAGEQPFPPEPGEAALAPRRATEDVTPRQSSLLRGDLTTILNKALAPEPERRYRSVHDFAADLRRYREGRPILAAPNSFRYRAGKFLRRNRLAVAAAALVLVAIAGGAAATLWQWRAARQQAARAERINVFMNQILGAADPGWYNPLRNKGANVKIVDVLDEMAGRIGKEFAGDAEVEIRLRRTIGRMYGTLGQSAKAREQHRLGLTRQLALTGPDHPDAGVFYKDLALAEYLGQQSREAVVDARKAIPILEKSPRADDRKHLLEAYNALGVSLARSDEPLPDSEAALRKALAISREVYGVSGGTRISIQALATVLMLQGKLEEGEALLREAMGLYRPEEKLSFERSVGVRDLGTVCLERDDYLCAEHHFREAAAGIEAAAGPGSTFVPNVRILVALATGLNGRVAEAERELDAQARRIVEIGGSGALTALAFVDEVRGRVRMANRQIAGAESSFRKAFEFYQRTRKDAVRNAILGSRLGECLLALEKRAEGEPLLRESIETLRRALGPAHVWTRKAEARMNVAAVIP